ncbi:MAG: hypothetical protein JW702_03945 [Clostridiales bacterium]|nr:hypothetical protein [Clostridiales bacterium]
MRKKIIIASATVLFAVATVFNMNLLQGNIAGDITLDAIEVMAQAQAENGDTQSCSVSKYDMVFNPGTGKYENVIVWSCTATCVFPQRPDCSESFGCRCL